MQVGLRAVCRCKRIGQAVLWVRNSETGSRGVNVVAQAKLTLQAEQSLPHHNAVYWVAFSNDGRQLATASLDNTVKLWNVADGVHVGTLKGHGDGVAFVGYLKDGRIVTASLDKSLRVWTADGAVVATLAGHSDYLTCAAVARTGTRFA